MKIVTSGQMRQIESRSAQAGVTTDILMENAGLQFAIRVRKYMGDVSGMKILVLVGSGNNGGDGLVSAKHLQMWGARVTIYLCGSRPVHDQNLINIGLSGMPIIKVSNDLNYARLKTELDVSSVVIDAILGTGISRPIAGTIKQILNLLTNAVNLRLNLTVIALDLPSGLNSDNGDLDPMCAGAALTVSLGYPKRGLFSFPGSCITGKVDTVDIGLPSGLDDDVDLSLITDNWAIGHLPTRPKSSHKGTFGKIMILAGSSQYIGAAALAASASIRVGAGLVTLAIPQSLQASLVSIVPEATYITLPESGYGEPANDAYKSVVNSLPDYDALLVGCGMGQSEGATRILAQMLYSSTSLPPTVIDADGLNFLAQSKPNSWWKQILGPTVITPHPGEMSRLVGDQVSSIQSDRISVATQTSKLWGKIVVLKGAHTVVSTPEGETKISPFANPALASAGTGDVLAGVIAGLISQNLSPATSAALGVYLHGTAGELVSDDLGDAGLAASDLLPMLPRAIKKIKSGD